MELVVKRNTTLTFFLLTFIISWGGLLFAIGGINQITAFTSQFEELLPAVILSILAGPSIAGVLLAVLVDKKHGLRRLISGLTKKVHIFWSMIVFFGPLIFVGTIYAILSLFSSKFLPGVFTVENKAPHIIAGFMTGVFAGFFEEIGWTGFATPQLRKKYSVLAVGLIVGLIWAFWHTLPGAWIGFGSGTVTSVPLLFSYFADSFLFLVVYRVLMVWVYDKTKSLGVAMIMHGSLTAAARIFTPIGIVGTQLLIFDLVWVTTLTLVATIALRRR